MTSPSARRRVAFGRTAIKTRLLEGLRSIGAARGAIVGFIETCCKPCRRHSTLGYLSPMEFEKTFIEENESMEPKQCSDRGMKCTSALRLLDQHSDPERQVPARLLCGEAPTGAQLARLRILGSDRGCVWDINPVVTLMNGDRAVR